MQTHLRALVLVGVIAMVAAVPATSYAYPAFARQTGLACAECHYQKYPALTPRGRDFKTGGFTEMGKEGKITGNRLSFPEMLNLSLFFKIRYQKSNGTEAPGERTTNSGEFQFPDEFVMLMGGRVSENIGFLLEGQLADHSAPFVAAFKMPFTFKVADRQASIIPFTTDALGAAFGFELLNTGAVRNIRVNENRKAVSAQQYVNTASTAEGVAFVLVDPRWFVNVTTWSPNHFAAAEGQANGSPSALYLRAAITPTVGGWDLGFGVQSWSGSAGIPNDSGGTDKRETRALAFDAQAQGFVGTLPLGVYGSTGKANATPAGATVPNLFNSRARDITATTVTAELGVLKDPHITIVGGYRVADNGRAAASSGDNGITLGANWMIAQNVGLHWIYNRFSGSAYAAGQSSMKPGGSGNALHTLMLSAGF